MSEVLALKMSIMLYDREKIGWGRGVPSVLFVTNRRVAVVKLKRKKSFPLTYRYDGCPDNLTDALKNEGSFEVAVSQILEAAPDTVMKTPYMRIRCNTDSGEKVFSFVLSAFWTSSGISPAAMTYYQMISEAITQAKKGTICVASPITDESINTPSAISFIKDLKKSRGTQAHGLS